jgi:hypothetical protein
MLKKILNLFDYCHTHCHRIIKIKVCDVYGIHRNTDGEYCIQFIAEQMVTKNPLKMGRGYTHSHIHKYIYINSLKNSRIVYNVYRLFVFFF